MIASVSYNKPGDDVDKLWHIDTYDCEGKVYQIEYTDYVYIDLKLLGASEIEETTVEEIQNVNVMTNRKLIDYCNSHWDKAHRCEECPYNRTYCDAFCANNHETPFMLDKYFDGKYYTDKEIKM